VLRVSKLGNTFKSEAERCVSYGLHNYQLAPAPPPPQWLDDEDDNERPEEDGPEEDLNSTSMANITHFINSTFLQQQCRFNL